MSGAVVAAPPGYERLSVAGATVVVREDAVRGIRRAMESGRSLYDWAAALPDATVFRGRAPAYGVRLPDSELEVVVRHAWHGGLLAPLTKDRFRWPGQAAWELEASLRLQAAAVPTPAMIAYALYPAGAGLCRSDVATQRLPQGADLPTLWAGADAAARAAMLDAAAGLVRALTQAGAKHEDLNVKNIHLVREGDGYRGFALDVDRVRFVEQGALDANLARLARSLRKARTQFGLSVSDTDIAALYRAAGATA